ncbi:MAG TPA: RidA family protein [Dehalococcoidia bacterium]|nr:RidA family protein [Dehalococcoidia bacterium]
MRQNVPSPSPFAPVTAFSAAVRVGNQVFVSGTVGRDPNGRFEPDVYAQAKQALANIEKALQAAGAALTDVVRTRMFVTNIDRWEDASRAHRDVFADILPACTLVEVSRLASPEMLIEIEADAVIESA